MDAERNVKVGGYRVGEKRGEREKTAKKKEAKSKAIISETSSRLLRQGEKKEIRD